MDYYLINYGKPHHVPDIKLIKFYRQRQGVVNNVSWVGGSISTVHNITRRLSGGQGTVDCGALERNVCGQGVALDRPSLLHNVLKRAPKSSKPMYFVASLFISI